jgi:hypothetical protein
MQKDYIPSDDEGKAAHFERFRDTIGSHAANLGLAPADVSNQAADATWFRYILNHTIAMRNSASQWTSYKNFLLGGTGSAVSPITPPLPTPVPDAVDPGILTRFRELVRRIKTSPNYLDATGAALGIIGTDSADADQSTLIPYISLRLNGGKVEIIWTKNGQEAIEIQVDRGTGIWTFLAIDTRPNYIDTEPLPATAAKWKYRAIYTNDAQRIGQWSNVAEISVGG